MHEIGEYARVILERPPPEVSPAHPLRHAVARGRRPIIVGAAYWMDIGIERSRHPVRGLWPPSARAHADEEWVNVASVERCVDVYLKAAELLCN